MYIIILTSQYWIIITSDDKINYIRKKYQILKRKHKKEYTLFPICQYKEWKQIR